MIDLVIVLLFVLYSVSTGFFYQKKASRGLVDYFLAGRTLKGWQAGFSMAATQYAADTPLLVTGLVATAGVFALWRLWIYAIAFLMMGFLLGGSWRRTQVLTDAEFTELRYSGTPALCLRSLKAVYMGTIVNCTILAMVLLAATRIAEPFLIWHSWLPSSFFMPVADFLEHFNLSYTTLPAAAPDYWIRSADNLISIVFIVCFVALYSTSGGLRSVVATDVVQFSISMIATGIYAFVVIQKIGGLEAIPHKLESLYGAQGREAILSFGPSEWNTVTFLFFAVLAVQWFAQINADGTGYLAQRTMACSSDREAKIAAVTFTLMQILLRTLLWLPLAVGLLILYPAAEQIQAGQSSEVFQRMREGTFAAGIKDFLPVGARGLMLTGMLAALASTVDTHLNWGASYWANDLYRRLLMKQVFKREAGSRELVWVGRLSNVGILLVALVIMSRLSSIQSAWHISLLFGSGLGVVLILRWIWHRINIWSELSAIASSLILAPVLLFMFPNMVEGLRLLVMTGITTFIMLTVTFLTKPESQTVIERFYLQVQPAGFWGPCRLRFKSLVGDPVARLLRSIAAIASASASIFFLLTGFGKLLFSQVSAATFCYLMTGFILIPLWYHLGFNRNEETKHKSSSLT